MSKRQKEILGLILIIFSTLSIISLFGHDITEDPAGLPENYKANNYLGYFGIWVSHLHYFLVNIINILHQNIHYTLLDYLQILFSIDFFVIKKGKKSSAGHFGKAVKGQLVNFIVKNKITSIDNFDGFEYDGFKWDGEIFIKEN